MLGMQITVSVAKFQHSGHTHIPKRGPNLGKISGKKTAHMFAFQPPLLPISLVPKATSDIVPFKVDQTADCSLLFSHAIGMFVSDFL